MKRSIRLAIVSILIAIPSWLLAQEGSEQYNHASVGVFADYLRFSPTNPNINFVGFGARTGFHASRRVQLEAEMHYDFERNFTTSFNNGVSTQFVTTKVRPLTGLFGPKFETGGRFKLFATGKVGFIRFNTSSSPVTLGNFGNAVSGVGGPGTHLAMYPGGGVEGFWGPFGLRLEAGDEIYLNNGTFNNLRVTFGPQIRF
jgi:opacity protein-like surface antigen